MRIDNTEERFHLKLLKPTDWAYAAGMLDADGSISITMAFNKNRKCQSYKVFDCKSEISNTETSVIDWLHEKFGGKSYQCVKHISKKAKANGQTTILPCHRWYADGSKLQKDFIEGILPYLVVKREQAKYAIEYLDMSINTKIDPNKRYELHLKVSALNDKLLRRIPVLNENSVEANMTGISSANDMKIESDLTGDSKSGPMVTSEAENLLSNTQFLRWMKKYTISPDFQQCPEEAFPKQ